MNFGRRRHKPDYWLPVLAAFLLAIGLITVYSISPGISVFRGVSTGKQLIATLLGVSAFVVLSKLPYEKWRALVKPLIVVSAIAALGVFVLGEEVNGAYRWIQIGGISFQAAELVKFAALIWAADLLAKRKADGELNNFNKTLKPLGIGLGLMFVVVAVLQSDLGSTVVMFSIVLAMMFVGGVKLGVLLKIGGIALLVAMLAIFASGYRRDRIDTFFNPTADCQNEGYQSCQAVIAVGSGGIFGLGLARSVQAYGYLPEASNDSIFAILAEKFGFIGVSLIVAAYAMLFSRLTRIVERAPDDFSRLIVTGILAWLSIQAFINIGAMIGLLPLKGITLPFVSTGGTSLLFVTGALGLAFQISRYANLGRLKEGEENVESSTYRRGNRRPYHTTTSRR